MFSRASRCCCFSSSLFPSLCLCFSSATRSLVYPHGFFLVAMGLIYAVCGIGILKLKRLALDTLIVVKLLFLASGIGRKNDSESIKLFAGKAGLGGLILEMASSIAGINWGTEEGAGLLAVFITYCSPFFKAAEASKGKHGCGRLARGDGWGFQLGVGADGRTDTGAGRHAVALIGQNFFERREKLQDKRLLAAVTHRAEAPDLALERSNASGDFDVEFIEELVANFGVVLARGNQDGGDRCQAVGGLFDEQLQAHGLDAGDKRELVLPMAFPTGFETFFQNDPHGFAQSVDQ